MATTGHNQRLQTVGIVELQERFELLHKQMPSITGTWSFNGSYSTQRVTSGNTPYKTYFALPLESAEGTTVGRFNSYADTNNNGIYDGGDLSIGESVVQSFGSLGGSSGTFSSPEGSNLVYSYIGDKLVGQTSLEGFSPWGTATASPSATGNANIPIIIDGTSTPATLTTTAAVDNLTGIGKTRDVFNFGIASQGQVDVITGFNAKDKDILRISKSSFGISGGKFAIAKNAKSLRKQLASTSDVVYSRKTGELILNSNGVEPGAGDNGGVFAILIGRPVLNMGSAEFY
jgi:hypothetical protein